MCQTGQGFIVKGLTFLTNMTFMNVLFVKKGATVHIEPI